MLLHENDQGGSSPVGRLVKPHLAFDPEAQTFRIPRNYNTSIPFTHGTTMSAIERLAEHGTFTRPPDSSEPFLNEFYLNVNPTYKKLAELDIDTQTVALVQALGQDALRLAIDYASNSEDGNIDEGVVVAVRPEVVKIGHHEVYYAEPTEGDLHSDIPELILPEPPAIDKIQGIYPVSELAAITLNGLLGIER